MKYIFAGDRDISVLVLKLLIENNLYPELLLVPDISIASHAKELISISKLPSNKIIVGKENLNEKTFNSIKDAEVDFIFGIHFPYIINKLILEAPKLGVLNLHPAYLPFNKGWHTPSWGIFDETPIGATLHFMSEELDSGDIVHQKQIFVSDVDTADTLYKKLKEAEFEVFKTALPSLMDGTFKRFSQGNQKGTSHKKKDLYSFKERKLDINEKYDFKYLLKLLRAFTTSDTKEAMYYEKNGKRYFLQIKITEMNG